MDELSIEHAYTPLRKGDHQQNRSMAIGHRSVRDWHLTTAIGMAVVTVEEIAAVSDGVRRSMPWAHRNQANRAFLRGGPFGQVGENKDTQCQELHSPG